MQFSTSRPRASAVLLTGCIVGVLDGAAALLNAWFKAGVTPANVFKYIASALFGRAAFYGGWEMVATGVVLHFLIAVFWSFLFFMLYPVVPLLRRNKWLVGAAYGLLVWVVMNLAVLPLTLVVQAKFNWQAMVTGWAFHILLVGIPIVLMARRWYTVTAKFP